MESLLEAIAVTSELTGTNLSPAAARVMAIDLARYPRAMVLTALTRCRRELKGSLTISDVMTRLDDGRQGPEEAWAMIPRDEYKTVVWTDEMASCMDVVHPLLEAGDEIAARMAFKEKYTKVIQKARDASVPVSWRVSLGYDVAGREAPIKEAIAQGKLAPAAAQKYLPDLRIPEEIGRLLQ